MARFQRHLAKTEEKLITFRRPIDSTSPFGIVELSSNTLTCHGDFESLLGWMREAGTLKPYEEIVG
jgi:hypothetical protein